MANFGFKGALESLRLASVPLIPKFASERAANACELRNRDTRNMPALAGGRRTLAALMDQRDRTLPSSTRDSWVLARDRRWRPDGRTAVKTKCPPRPQRVANARGKPWMQEDIRGGEYRARMGPAYSVARAPIHVVR